MVAPTPPRASYPWTHPLEHTYTYNTRTCKRRHRHIGQYKTRASIPLICHLRVFSSFQNSLCFSWVLLQSYFEYEIEFAEIFKFNYMTPPWYMVPLTVSRTKARKCLTCDGDMKPRSLTVSCVKTRPVYLSMWGGGGNTSSEIHTAL
jgi:hypothetical protein